MNGSNTDFLLGWPIFRGYVSVIYKQSANSLHFDVETVLSQVFDFPQLWLCCKSCQAICRRWWSLGLPSPIGAKHVGKWRWRWAGSRFEKRRSTSAEKQKKTGSGYMSFLKVEEFWILMIWWCVVCFASSSCSLSTFLAEHGAVLAVPG